MTGIARECGSLPSRGGRRRPPLGQHFLVDATTIERIVEALGVGAGDLVLEIGPGRGALTAALARRGVRVAAIEIDARLVERLGAQFDRALVRVLQADVLTHDLQRVAELFDDVSSGGLVVVSNLPYAVSKPIAQKLVAERGRIARAVLMFQREVAERVRAAPGSRAYGPLAVLCGQAYTIERLFDVPPRAFRPPPAVASSVTRWIPRSGDAALDPRLEPALRACLAACFGRRRQTLRNNLRAALGSAERADALLGLAGLDPGERAERIDPSGFLRLARAFGAAGLL